MDLKPPLEYQEQINLLKSRNLVIEDEAFAKNILSNVNYYRLSAYGLTLRKDNVFNTGTRFEELYALYKFDGQLRNLVLNVTSTIEITLRTKIAYYLATNYGGLSYLDPSRFKNYQNYDDFYRIFCKEKEQQNRLLFVKHHEARYDGKMPVWVAVELFTFGMLSKFYSNLLEVDQKEIAKTLSPTDNVIDAVFFRSWMKALVNIRNRCAHYNRIYNARFQSAPRLFKEHQNLDKNTFFVILLVVGRLVYNKTEWEDFVICLMELIEKNPCVNIECMGFPKDWDNILFNLKN
jgi:Abortive infection bacteriophage resistance protein